MTTPRLHIQKPPHWIMFHCCSSVFARKLPPCLGPSFPVWCRLEVPLAVCVPWSLPGVPSFLCAPGSLHHPTGSPQPWVSSNPSNTEWWSWKVPLPVPAHTSVREQNSYLSWHLADPPVLRLLYFSHIHLSHVRVKKYPVFVYLLSCQLPFPCSPQFTLFLSWCPSHVRSFVLHALPLNVSIWEPEGRLSCRAELILCFLS